MQNLPVTSNNVATQCQDDQLKQAQQLVAGNPQLRDALTAVVEKNANLEFLIGNLAEKFTLQANSALAFVRKENTETELRLQAQINQQDLRIQQLMACGELLANQNQNLNHRLIQQAQVIQDQNARIDGLTDERRKDELHINGLQNDLRVACQKIDLNRLNSEILLMGTTYNQQRETYLKYHEEYTKITQKKLLIHVVASVTGAVVAGPAGFYTGGGLGLANLVRPDSEETAAYRGMVNAWNGMSTVCVQLQQLATKNRTAHGMLANLQKVPSLPAPPTGYG